MSEGVLGYFVLLMSGLTENETTHVIVIGLVGKTLDFSPMLRDLDPQGTIEGCGACRYLGPQRQQ